MEKPPLTYPHTLLSSVRHRASRRAPGLHGPDLAHAFSLISRLRLQDNVLHEHKSFPFFVRAFLCTTPANHRPHRPLCREAFTPLPIYASPYPSRPPPLYHRHHRAPSAVYWCNVNWHQIFPGKT